MIEIDSTVRSFGQARRWTDITTHESTQRRNWDVDPIGSTNSLTLTRWGSMDTSHGMHWSTLWWLYQHFVVARFSRHQSNDLREKFALTPAVFTRKKNICFSSKNCKPQANPSFCWFITKKTRLLSGAYVRIPIGLTRIYNPHGVRGGYKGSGGHQLDRFKEDGKEPKSFMVVGGWSVLRAGFAGSDGRANVCCCFGEWIATRISATGAFSSRHRL